MVNYFIKDDDQNTPTGTVTPTVQPSGKTAAPQDARKVSTPVVEDVQPSEPVAAAPKVVDNGLKQGVSQPAAAKNDNAPAEDAPAAQNYFAPNTETKDVTQGGQSEDEGLSDEEQAYLAMNDSILNNYRRQYKQGEDITQGVYDYLTGGKEEEPYKKENESKKKLLALSDAIRHIGNLMTVTDGATPQKFNSPVVEQEARYQQERAYRDKERAARAKAALDKAKRDAQAAYNDALLQMKNNAFNKSVYDSYKKSKADNDKFEFNKDKFDKEYTLKQDKFKEQQEYNKKMLELKGESNSIARGRLALAYAKESRLAQSAGQGSLGKGSVRYVTPAGVTYDLSANFVKPANLKIIYNAMDARGLIHKEVKEGIDKYGNSDVSATNMLTAIMTAATESRAGHEVFTYFANRLKYKYVGGMNDALARKLIAGYKPKTQQSKSAQTSKPAQQKAQNKPAPQNKPKTPAKTPSKPKSSQKGGTVQKSHNGYKNTKALGL